MLDQQNTGLRLQLYFPYLDTILFKSVDTKIFYRRPESIKTGFNPGLFHSYGCVWVSLTSLEKRFNKCRSTM